MDFEKTFAEEFVEDLSEITCVESNKTSHAVSRVEKESDITNVKKIDRE